MTRVDPARVARVREALVSSLGPDRLRDDAESLARFGHDESGLPDLPPDLVAIPRDALEVETIVRACAAHGVPFIAVGARTGKSGGSLAARGGVAISLEKLDQILSIHPGDLVAVVQPGVRTGDLQRAVEAHGLFYPPDPNSSDTCTLGGNVAENAGGPRALKYGVTRDYVLGLEWVLPGGDRVRVGRRTSKGVAGYDLVGLLVGSEGTLGIATEITLRLIPKPRAVKTALAAFRTVAAAAEAVTRVLTSGTLPRALELLDDVALAAVAGQGVAFPEGAGAVLITELDGSSDDALLAELVEVERIFSATGALETQIAQNESQREALWRVRRLVSPGLRVIKGRKLSEDVVVPRSRIPEAIARFKAAGDAHGLVVATYGHAGDGNLHANVLFDSDADRPKVQAVLDAMMAITLELGGTITGEHGVGLAKLQYLPLEHSKALLSLEKRLRVFFDPQVLANPGKVFSDG